MLLGAAEVRVPEAVYEEAVLRGKAELYEDAFEIERALTEGGVAVLPGREEAQAGRLLDIEGGASLGPGERAALGAYFSEGAAAILTDDRGFLNFLERCSIPAMTPANAVVALTESDRLGREEGLEALRRMRPHIRAAVYEAAVEDLEDLEDQRKEKNGDNL